MSDLAAAATSNLAVLRREGDDLATLAAGAWDAPTPSCPGWSAGDVVGHTGSIHRWVEVTVRTGERSRRRDRPGPPEGRDATLDWYRAGLDDLIERLGEAGPDAEVWAFGASRDHRVAWWMRRMAQETGVHRWDAAAAAHAAGGSAPAGFEAGVAAAGVDEYLADFLPSLPPAPAGTLHLHATDTRGEWFVDLADPAGSLRREHAKAATALRGPASDLLLWLWNRQPAAGHLELLGDTAVADGWTSRCI
jgi:uncharacterized protein (TIGR03083 family)